MTKLQDIPQETKKVAVKTTKKAAKVAIKSDAPILAAAPTTEPQPLAKEPKAKKAKKSYSSSNLKNVESYLTDHYQFRYNVVKQQTEWKPKYGSTDWTEMDDYKLNSIRREMEYANVKTNPNVLRATFQSEFVPLIDPIKSYFKALPLVKDFDNINKLLDCLTMANPEIPYRTFFTKWLVATVANIMISEDCQNQTCLMLTGEQGIYKTKFLRSLCPPTLTEYLFTGQINLDSKDTEFKLARYFLMNIDDQFKKLNKKDAETVKTLITLPEIKSRRAYAVFEVQLPRRASFMGSVNGSEFLNDSTGSRRFIVFDTTAIDFEAVKKIDINLVWAEGLYAFRKGFRYWFDADETKRLNENNEAFAVVSPEYEALTSMYEPCPRGTGEMLTSTQIMNRLSEANKVYLSLQKLGEALRKAGFNRWQKGTARSWVYDLKYRDDTTED